MSDLKFSEYSQLGSSKKESKSGSKLFQNNISETSNKKTI